MHSGTTKMYQTIKENYWWSGMKKDVVEYVFRCLVCQQVKAEHQKPIETLQPFPIPKWKWAHITMDFVVGLPRTQINHDAIWMIMDRLTKLAHFLIIRSAFSLERLIRLLSFMEYWYQLCQIRIFDSHFGFGQDYRKFWVLPCILALFFIL